MKINKNNIIKFLLDEVPEFKNIYNNKIDKDDEDYYIIARCAERFSDLQNKELRNLISEIELIELQHYYNFIDKTLDMSEDIYVEEIIAFSFFENLDNENEQLITAVKNKISDKAKQIFIEVEEFWE